MGFGNIDIRVAAATKFGVELLRKINAQTSVDQQLELIDQYHAWAAKQSAEVLQQVSEISINELRNVRAITMRKRSSRAVLIGSPEHQAMLAANRK